MAERSVGVRELKERLSAYLRRVQSGETIVVTVHGRAVGRILPASLPLEDRLRGMVSTGALAWNGKKLKTGRKPVARVRGKGTVAGLLVAGRE